MAEAPLSHKGSAPQILRTQNEGSNKTENRFLEVAKQGFLEPQTGFLEPQNRAQLKAGKGGVG